MPLLFIPIIQIAKFNNGIIPNNVIANALIILLVSVASIEMFDWLHYDKEKFIAVDSTQQQQHMQHVVAGTFKYTSPDIFKCVLPAIVTTFGQIICGIVMMTKLGIRQAAMSGPLLVLLGGITALISASPTFSKRPDIQLFLEPLSLLILWKALSQVTI